MNQSAAEFLAQLKALRDDKLEPWKATHESFDAYCRAKLGYGERRANQLIAGGATRMGLLAEAGEDPELAPVIEEMKEDALREVASLPKQEAIAVLRKAIALPASANGKPVTAAKIKLAKARVITPTIDVWGGAQGDEPASGAPSTEPEKKSAPAACCPACQRPL